MINYEVVPLRGHNDFDLNGVRFNGKSFMFWKKKSTQVVTEVVVIFDKKHENMQLRDGVAILSLKGLNNYQDLYNAIAIFKEIMKSQQIKIQFHFVVENENERKMAEALGNNLELLYVVQNVNQNKEQNLKVMEEQLKKSTNTELSTDGNQMIEKYDNGTLKKITIHDGIAYENNGILDSEEEKVSLLREWMQDPKKADELMKMSEKARNELLTQAVMTNRKQYRLEESNKQVANDRAGEVAQNLAEREGSLVNKELNVIQHDTSKNNQISAVERNGNNVQVVNPDVTKSQVSTNGVSSSSVVGDGTSDFYTNGDADMMEEEEQQRALENQIFYIDENGNILNNQDEKIGKLGQDGYEMDFENNTLLRYQQMVGYIGDYKDRGKINSNVYYKPNVRTLKKKPEEYKSAAFVSLPVIMFILSALLLIGSLVLLFVLN